LHETSSGGINMEGAWDIEMGDPNVIIAILDTGIAYEDFDEFNQAPDFTQTRFIPGYDFINDDNHPNDDQGHGTHVAGTIAQSTNNEIGVAGIAFGCSLCPVKVLDHEGYGDHYTITQGIYYAVAQGARVINLSLGSDGDSNTLRNAIAYAYDQGVTIVCSAGNEFLKGNTVSYPAAYDDYCIAVGATAFDKTRAPYSNTGDYVDLCAPGGDVQRDLNQDGYVDGILQQTFQAEVDNFAFWFFQGTSMAAPHVSGAAALLISHGITEPDRVREALENTAVDLGQPGWDTQHGWGLLDVEAALLYWDD
jgi:serine protease